MLKRNKKMIIIFSVILALVMLYVAYYYINISKMKTNAKKFETKITELKNNQIEYIFIDINPAFTLTVKNDIVIELSCRNDDCEKLKDKINTKELDVVSSIKEIKEKTEEAGYDTKKGINITSTSSIHNEVKNIDYVKINEISKDEEKELLSKGNHKIDLTIKDNKELIKNLKKDEDYGKYYTCKIVEEKAECYLKPNIKFDTVEFLTLRGKRVANVLHKFGIKTKSVWEAGIIEESLFYIYVDGVRFTNLGGESVEDFAYTAKVNCSYTRFNLSDLNLLNPTDIKKHYYYSEYDIIYEPQTYKNTIERSCGDVYCKKIEETLTSKCINNNVEDFFEKEYIIFTKDNKIYNNVTSEEYEEFSEFAGMNKNYIEHCKYTFITEYSPEHPNGRQVEIPMKPTNGNYCYDKDGNITGVIIDEDY